MYTWPGVQGGAWESLRVNKVIRKPFPFHRAVEPSIPSCFPIRNMRENMRERLEHEGAFPNVSSRSERSVMIILPNLLPILSSFHKYFQWKRISLSAV